MVPARLKQIFAAIVALTLLGLLVNYSIQPDLRYCFLSDYYLQAATTPAGDGALYADVLAAPLLPTPGRSIFFHETSCYPPHEPHHGQLTARQACAIESAAKYNPRSPVFVLFASPTRRTNTNTNSNTTTTRSAQLDALQSYANVHFRNLNIWTYAAGTPVEQWLHNGDLFRSSYVLSHVSDFLRYITLWRWGGTYLDMDVVMLRSIEDMPPNFTGAESDTHLAAGVMNFGATGFGHQIAEACLHEFQNHFRGSDWGHNGPGVITRVMQTVCGTSNIALMQDEPRRCRGFRVFGPDAFYAIPWLQWRHFFAPERTNETLARIRHSYVAHVWNKHSQVERVRVGANAAYGKLAAAHCPKVYASAGEFF